jgi:hypothetical protein
VESVVKAVLKPIAKALFQIPVVLDLLLVCGGLLFGYMALETFTEEVRYSLDGQQATAQVEKSTSGKHGSGNVVLTYEAAGKTVKATMSTWFSNPGPGEQVAILYRPDKPHLVHLDSFWRRFLWPVSGVLLFGFMFCFGLWDFYRTFRSGGWRDLFRPRKYESPSSAEGYPVAASGLPVEPGTPLEVGSRVLAYEQSQWWRAEVVALDPDNMVRIRFPGWDSRWDRSVSKTELQLNPDNAAAKQVRNPFGVADVPDPDGEDVRACAAREQLTGGAQDANAGQWAMEASLGDKDSLDGEWYGRWNFAGGEWSPIFKAEVRSAGGRVYILYKDHQGRYLIDLCHEKDRLVGRTQGIDITIDAEPCAFVIVDPERIDGSWGGKGRLDFRRKLNETTEGARSATAIVPSNPP